jgi:hypothetical protein
MKKNGKLITVQDNKEINNVDLLEQLHSIMILNLIKKVKSGESTAQDDSNVIRFLKDNGVTTLLDINEIKDEGFASVLDKLRMDIKEESKTIDVSDIKIPNMVGNKDEK